MYRAQPVQINNTFNISPPVQMDLSTGVARIELPSGLVGATLSFEGSIDFAVYRPLFKEGSLLTISYDTSAKSVALPVFATAGLKAIKIVTNLPQTSDKIFTLVFGSA